MSPKVAVRPSDPVLEEAARAGGATLVEPDEADAIIWAIPRDPEGLKQILASSPATWVQLPFAGIERFFEADAIDPGRTWTCAKGIYGSTTAEGALALTLAAARQIHTHARATSWEREYVTGDSHRRLVGTTAVVIGTGGIGSEYTRMVAPLGPRVIGVNRSGRPMEHAERTVTVAELDDVLAEADWVVLALALTPESHGLFDRARFQRMQPGAWLINVARGGLVVTDDLVEALHAGEIAGAALDVTDPEPLPDGHPLWTMPNVLITPHVANTWTLGMPELQALIERNVAAFARGEPLEGLVDPAAGY